MFSITLKMRVIHFPLSSLSLVFGSVDEWCKKNEQECDFYKPENHPRRKINCWQPVTLGRNNTITRRYIDWLLDLPFITSEVADKLTTHGVKVSLV